MTRAVLLMAYGSPRTPDEVGPYLRDIRGGREPSEGAVAELASRYQCIGGTSPLLDITRRQAAALEDVLRMPVHVGMKHWHPYIRETVEEIAAAGADEVLGLALAPHYSRMSIGGYEDLLREASADRLHVRMVRSWYDEPAFVDFVAANLRDTLGEWTEARVVFSAHSLPERVLADGDPYVDELTASAKLVADRAGVSDWEFAFQSASPTGVPWLGPDVGERLDALAGSGVRRVVVAPIGFVADHLEILFDVDVLYARRARELGVELRRIPSPNDAPRFVDALAHVARKAMAS